MTLAGFICSYVNPDTDGVCSSLGYAYLREHTDGAIFTPVVFGSLNRETAFVFSHFDTAAPPSVTQVPSNRPIVLVDTHHVDQLPQGFPYGNVIEIIDHHPAGDERLFPNASIQNEEVGAAATLITERLKNTIGHVDGPASDLLAAAIASNTLNFAAPSTTNRDIEAYTWLSKQSRIDDEFIHEMFSVRSRLSDLSTYEILAMDYKEFIFDNVRFGISQVETTNLTDLLDRSDLVETIHRFWSDHRINHYLVNGVDILAGTSTLLTVNAATKRILQHTLGATFEGISAHFPRILLRKTDLVPAIHNLSSSAD